MFDKNWNFSNDLHLGGLKPKNKMVKSGRLIYKENAASKPNYFGNVNVAGIIGENGTGKTSIIRALGRGLCGSMDNDREILLLIWETEIGKSMIWRHDKCNIKVVGAKPTHVRKLPACSVFYCDQVGALSGRPLLDNFLTATPYHNLYDCSQLGYLHKDAAIAAVPSSNDYDMDGSSTVEFSEVLERHRFSDTIRIARLIQRISVMDEGIKGNGVCIFKNNFPRHVNPCYCTRRIRRKVYFFHKIAKSGRIDLLSPGRHAQRI